MEFKEFNTYLYRKKIDLLETWKASGDVDDLIMALDDPDYEVSGRASEMLVSLGRQSVKGLIKAANSANFDVRSWAVVSLGLIEDKNIEAFLVLVKLAINDSNPIVRSKASHAILGSIQMFIKSIKSTFELFFYFIVISIVQLVILIFFIVPIIIVLDNQIPYEYDTLSEIIDSILLASIIPIASGFAAAYLFKIKEQNFPLSALIGVIQNIPYNFFLVFIIQQFDIINCFILPFGILGGIFGHYYYLNEIRQQKIEDERISDIEVEEQKNILFLIFQRIKLSKQFQDKIIVVSSIVGLVLILLLSILIYNVSSISTNKKDFGLFRNTSPLNFGTTPK